jgi:hypothetical protein
MYSSIRVDSHPRSDDISVERVLDLLKDRLARRRIGVEELTKVNIWSDMDRRIFFLGAYTSSEYHQAARSEWT